MHYTESDLQQMTGLLQAKLLDMIQAKKDIQNAVLPSVSSAESWALAMNTVPQSLVDKVMNEGKKYLNKTEKKRCRLSMCRHGCGDNSERTR